MGTSASKQTASQEIDAIIKKSDDWRGKKLAELRTIIKKAYPDVIEEVKWKKPSRPEGVPVWSHNGMLCVADTLKNAVRLNFVKGILIKDPRHLFNARLDSKGIRAIDFHEDDKIDEPGLKSLVLEAVSVNNKNK